MKRYLNLILLFALACPSFAGDDPVRIAIQPSVRYQTLEGWGASLCWWASMSGRWDEKKVDELIDLITSPDQLNMTLFRYNIGGGDDPTHADGHMVKGKGKRAEMEGFKPGADAPYNWDADAGQRNILLKIRDKRPDAIFEAFSNSAPYWMTYSGCSGGNEPADKDNLKPEYYDMFCDYLIDVCKHYKEKYGLEFRTLEPFNESTSAYWGYLGSQEGCHFDPDSQIRILNILFPKLKASGLNTVLSASDETNLASTLRVLEAYDRAGGIPELLGQFNTHTYQGSNAERVKVREWMDKWEKPLWQSETGPDGGRGLESNLRLTQKMFDDLRLMKPNAWLDWQLLEEHNAEWCVIRCDFAKETYEPVKNFYVRMQVTRFVKAGYTLIGTDDERTLAALSPDGKELVVVVNNPGAERNLILDMSGFRKVSPSAVPYRTGTHENCLKLADMPVTDKSMRYTAPGQSLTTLIIPVSKTPAR